MNEKMFRDALEHYPRSMTILPTYRCNAACAECCFESNPTMSARLTISQIKDAIDEAASSFPALELVVFSGGECFLLGDDLIEAISHVTSHGLCSRCVTNGFWGRSAKTRRRTVRKLLSAGLTEINISTGLDHQKWVNVDYVIEVAKECVDHGIVTLVTVEKDTADSQCFDELRENDVISELLANADGRFRLVRNIWMPFHSSATNRGWSVASLADKPCDQVFSNIVVTPYQEVSACCGLTFEYIPEMKLGKLGDRSFLKMLQSEFDDFLKIWIHMDGPYQIMRKLFGPEVDNDLANVTHICQACVIMHKNDAVRREIQRRWMEFAPEVLHRFFLSLALDTKLADQVKRSIVFQ